MTRRSLVVNTEVMDEVQKQQAVGLRVPDDAPQKGMDEDATYTWTEALLISDTTVEQDKKNSDTYVVVVDTRVDLSSPTPVNTGKGFRQWFRVDFAALEAGDKTAGRYKMSIFPLSKLKQLVQAAGHEVDSGGFDLWAWFAPEGSPKPLRGAVVLAKIKDAPGEDQDGNPRRQQEATKFIAVTD